MAQSLYVYRDNVCFLNVLMENVKINYHNILLSVYAVYIYSTYTARVSVQIQGDAQLHNAHTVGFVRDKYNSFTKVVIYFIKHAHC